MNQLTPCFTSDVDFLKTNSESYKLNHVKLHPLFLLRNSPVVAISIQVNLKHLPLLLNLSRRPCPWLHGGSWLSGGRPARCQLGVSAWLSPCSAVTCPAPLPGQRFPSSALLPLQVVRSRLWSWHCRACDTPDLYPLGASAPHSPL